MPQLELMERYNPIQISWTYLINPLRPEVAGSVMCQVYNAQHQIVDFAYVTKLTSLTHEEVEALLIDTWQAYLFGERGDIQKAARSVHARFKIYDKT